MVWDVFSKAGKIRRLIAWKPECSSISVQHLNPIVVPFIDIMGVNAALQDDHARPHLERIVSRFLQQHRTRNMTWPTCSIDLNLIERVEVQLLRAVRRRLQRNNII